MGITDGPEDPARRRLRDIGRLPGKRDNRGTSKGEKITAGRDLPVAILVSLVLITVVVLSIWIGPVAWYPLVALAVAVAMWEVLTRLREKSYQLPKWVLIGLGQLIIWLSWPFGTEGALGAFAGAVIIVMFSQLFHHGRHAPPQNYLRDTAVAMFVLTWIPLFGSFGAMLALFSRGEVPGTLFIITFMACVVASDTGGYTAGVLFGTHPMAPAISPKKTWEGFFGSVIAGVVVGMLTVVFLLDHEWWMGILLGISLVITATFGDLVESQFKREVGIKDMSNLLPGHGGVMDRLDGMLPSAVVTWLLLGLVV